MNIRKVYFSVALLLAWASAAGAQPMVYYPTIGGAGTWAFEDNWPKVGDFDFNDVVVRYNLAYTGDPVTELDIVIQVVARGAGLVHSGFAVSLPVDAAEIAGAWLMDHQCNLTSGVLPEEEAGAGQATFKFFDDIFAVLPGGCIYANSQSGCAAVPWQQYKLKIVFAPGGADLAMLQASTNPFIFFAETRHAPAPAAGRRYEVHLPGFAPTALADTGQFGRQDDGSTSELPYVTNDKNGHVAGLPWALDVPLDDQGHAWKWPEERTSILVPYAHLEDWVEAGGASWGDWHAAPTGQAAVWSESLAEQPAALCDPLIALEPSEGQLGEAFSPWTTAYSMSLDVAVQSISFRPTLNDPLATVTVNGEPVASGEWSSAITLAAGATSILVEIVPSSGASRIYDIAIERGIPVDIDAYIKASNTGTNDAFGYSMAVSGDTLAIAAYKESSSATGVDGDESNNAMTGAGAVYVFVRSGSTWVQQAYIKASNTDAGDNFGQSVALSGDTLAVGAFKESSGATGIDGDQGNDANFAGSGAVYVYQRSAGVWSQQAYIKASNTGKNDYFGWSVALAGDTLVVGATREASNATGVDGDQSNNAMAAAGAVYVFTRSGSSWSQQAYIKASNTQAADLFGSSLTLSGETLAVGALGQGSFSGAVYVFTRNGSSWSQQAFLKASNSGANDYFGTSVALLGDRLAVGAYGEGSNATGVDGDESNNSMTGAGAVYIFARQGTDWSQETYLKASNTNTGDQFGYNLALLGDVLAVAAPSERSNAVGVDGDQTNNTLSMAGAVYLFRHDDASWTETAYLKASNTGAQDGFGSSIGLVDGLVVVGATGESSSAAGVYPDSVGQDNNDAAKAGAAYGYAF